MYKQRPVIGGDTETYNGKPYTIQLYSPEQSAFVYVSPKQVWGKFLNCLAGFQDGSILYFHNLEFDLPILFFPFLQHFRESSFTLTAGVFKAEILYGKVNHANIWLGDKTYEIVDTFAYFKASLDAVARMLGLDPKKRKPKGLGNRRYTGNEKKAFEDYAMHDAVLTYHVGKEIQNWHRENDINNTISIPQMSARIFRKVFIPEGGVIPSVPEEIEEPAVLSYHGGKNTMAGKPGIHKNVRLYDINSAYPYAFVCLPNFLNCNYDFVRDFDRKRHGIYQVSGNSIAGVYNPLRNHNFETISGPFEGLWFTSFELQCAIRNGFLSEYTIHEGFVVQETQQKINPLKNFALYYYQKKQQAKEKLTRHGVSDADSKEIEVEREFYKLMLNSLYGKFIQTTGNTLDDDVFETRYFEAGGLWNPLLASLITGFVRSYLTDLEIRYSSLHSSTDSLITRKRIPVSSKLGMLSLKTQGSVLLLRPKFYLLWNNGKLETFATHGYHGTLQMLFAILRKGGRKYYHQHMMKVKESYVQKKQPFIMEMLPKSISIPIEGKIELPKLTWTRPDGKVIKL